MKGWPAGCRNCDSPDHLVADCSLDKADCSVCGLAAGHLDHHCLAQSDCPIPASIPAPVKAKLLARRKAFFAKQEVAAVAIALPSLADEAELMAWLADQDSDNDCGDCDE